MSNQEVSKEAISIKISPTLKAIREVFSVLIWGSIFTEIFITDVGDILISFIPQLEQVFRYRLLIILGAIASLWLILRDRLFIQFFGYITTYPIILIVWKIPKIFIKNWAVVIAFSPAIYHLLKTFKSNFIIGVIVLITGFIVCLSPPDWLFVPIGMSIIGIYLVYHFVNRFRSAYSPTTIFTVLRESVTEVLKTMKDYISENLPEGDSDSEEYKDKLGQC